MKVADMAQKTDKELEQLVADTRKEIAELAVDYRTKQVSNVKSIAVVRKRLAQALTLQRERAIAKMENKDE